MCEAAKNILDVVNSLHRYEMRQKATHFCDILSYEVTKKHFKERRFFPLYTIIRW